MRNSWAHCNFDEWDSLKYQTAFKLLNQLVICLQLNTADEAGILAELNKWEENGNFTFNCITNIPRYFDSKVCNSKLFLFKIRIVLQHLIYHIMIVVLYTIV